MSFPVLVIVDGDVQGPLPQLTKAQRLSQATDIPLHVWVNAHVPSLRQAARFEDSLMTAAREHLQAAWEKRIADELGDYPHTLEIAFHKQPLAPLRALIMTLEPRLTVVATDSGSTLQRHLFTPRDWQLIRKAPCPVLCVHEQPWQASPKVVAAVDPEAMDEEDLLSAQIVQQARHLGGRLGGSLQAVHVMENLDETLVLIAGETVPDYARSADKIAAFHRENFHSFADGQGLSREQQVVLEGPIATTLGQYCEEQQADILAVGTVHRNLAERLFLGSTAETLISKAKCDVLVIKPEGFRSPWQ